MKFTNKKATFEYEILDKEIAGICLLGTEVKSIRAGNISINESFISIINGIPQIHNMNINEYSLGTSNNHEPKRVRQLLLTKNQIKKWSKSVTEKGLTIIPLSLFTTDTGMFKLEIALCKGKKIYDKRESIKSRDVNRDLARTQL